MAARREEIAPEGPFRSLKSAEPTTIPDAPAAMQARAFLPSALIPPSAMTSILSAHPRWMKSLEWDIHTEDRSFHVEMNSNGCVASGLFGLD